MPAKYAEGTVSPTGQFIVQGGQWVPIESKGVTTDSRPTGYRVAESLHTDERGRTLSFPHMAAPADPEARGYAMTALALPAGAALRGAGGAIGKAVQWAGTPAGGATIGAAEGIRRGPMEAIKGAAVGALGGPALGKAGRMIRFLGRFKAAAPAAEAAAAVATKAPAIEEGAVQALRSNLPMTQDELGMLMQLKGHMQTSAGRLAAKEAVKEVFPNNWQEVWKFLTAGRTTMAGRLR